MQLGNFNYICLPRYSHHTRHNVSEAAGGLLNLKEPLTCPGAIDSALGSAVLYSEELLRGELFKFFNIFNVFQTPLREAQK